MQIYRTVFAIVIAISAAPSAEAQVTIDATKITCDQFVHQKIGTPRVTGAWLSGFFHGKRDNGTIDLAGFDENLRKLESFCYQEKNFKMPVMQAIEETFGVNK
jgi:acid stress chaperone HdeB